MAELRVSDLTVLGERGVTLVEGASVALRSGELVALIGPNGAGKSSLFRAIMGYQTGSSSAEVDGVRIAQLPARQRARLIGWLPQSHPMTWPIRVYDAIAMGRFAHGAVIGHLTAGDEAAVCEAIDACALQPLQHRITTTLSGGELARVHLARCLAARAPLLLADEPVASLDPHHRYAIMALLRDLARQGHGILVILHDLELAARFSDRLIVMNGGKIVAEGSPHDVMTVDMLQSVYGVAGRIDDADGWPRPVLYGAY